LQTVVWTIPAELVEISGPMFNTDPLDVKGKTQEAATVALVRLSSGTNGVIYECTCHFVTVAGDEDDRVLTVSCQDGR